VSTEQLTVIFGGTFAIVLVVGVVLLFGWIAWLDSKRE
jgi:hypothetical protein